MHIGYVPFKTETVNDILWIDDAMRLLLKRVRAQAPIGMESWKECEGCRIETLIEYHHVRPLWSVATEAILRVRPQKLSDLGDLTRDIYYGHLDILTDDAHGELAALCPRCHDLETKASNRKWKRILSEQFPLLWTYVFKLNEFEALVERWYGSSKWP